MVRWFVIVTPRAYFFWNIWELFACELLWIVGSVSELCKFRLCYSDKLAVKMLFDLCLKV